jgi:serine/threonine protein phosphatase 1
MRGIIRRLFGPEVVPVFDAPLVIDRPTYAIGDIHGRFDLLVPLMRKVIADAQDVGITSPRLVFMGDYIDRGEQSRQVLDFLFNLAHDPGDIDGEVVMLRGNHEEMLLDFLRHPAEEGARWLRSGGLQTLLSYGVGGVTASADAAALTNAAAKLAEAMGPHVDALARLPIQARFGNVFFAHAGADPSLPTSVQSPHTLVWGTRTLFSDLRDDGVWVCHGHYVVDEGELTRGRIPVDTGAYFSGKLTAVRLSGGTAHFLSAED